MFDSKILHPVDDDLTEVKPQTDAKMISSVKISVGSTVLYCCKIRGSQRGTVEYLSLLVCHTM